MWLLLCFLVNAIVITRSGNVDMKCTEKYCHKELDDCLKDEICRKLMSCSSVCMEKWNDDPTPQKVHAQNCTLKCSASYENEVSDTFMSCDLSHNCMTFPPINVTCPASLSKHVESNSSIGDLSGEWWQQYGHNPLWDCYPCQHIHSMRPMNHSIWAYTYSYEIYMVNNSLVYFEQTWYLPNPPQGVTINITYTYMGTGHQESWYILQATDRYVVLVDCSYMFTWTNVGSILWVRPNVVLTSQEMESIAQVYKASLGWNFPKDFCKTEHGSSCPKS